MAVRAALTFALTRMSSMVTGLAGGLCAVSRLPHHCLKSLPLYPLSSSAHFSPTSLSVTISVWPLHCLLTGHWARVTESLLPVMQCNVM